MIGAIVFATSFSGNDATTVRAVCTSWLELQETDVQVDTGNRSILFGHRVDLFSFIHCHYSSTMHCQPYILRPEVGI